MARTQVVMQTMTWLMLWMMLMMLLLHVQQHSCDAFHLHQHQVSVSSMPSFTGVQSFLLSHRWKRNAASSRRRLASNRPHRYFKSTALHNSITTTDEHDDPVFRIGHGYDIHRLIEGKPLIIAGVNIPFHLGADAHSDGDAVYHSVVDAILGALTLPDIGQLFPGWSLLFNLEFFHRTNSAHACR